MPGPKKQTPPPIDRPLSKAYLRKFTGWATAAPPGLSDPASLRVMHNCTVDPDGALRIRPGLQRVFDRPAGGDLVGTFEHFYTTDGKKALLFARRDAANGNRVVFRTAVYDSTLKQFTLDPDVFTRFPGATDANLAFNSSTTYVKYVQIDNKILALSDSGEAFREFWVGSTRAAKKITAVTKPVYSTAEALTVMQPESNWVIGYPIRTNIFPNPLSTATTGWSARNSWTLTQRSTGTGLPSGIKTYVRVECVTAGAATHSGLNYGNPAATTPVDGLPIKEQTKYMFSAYMHCTKAVTFTPSIRFSTATDTWIATAVDGTSTSLPAGVWTRVSFVVDAPAAATKVHIAWRVPASITFAVNDIIGITMLLAEEASVLNPYFDGSSAYAIPNVSTRWNGAAYASSSSLYNPTGLQDEIPTPIVQTTDTLTSSDPTKNQYNFGYYYSFSNEIGEGLASKITQVKTQRRWTAWRANAADDKTSSDQLVSIIPQTVYDAALAQGALAWNLYYCTWSDQDNVPIEGILLKTISMVGTTYALSGWASHTPLLQGLDGLRALPNATNTDNFTDPATAGQGIVAGDRLVLVYDRNYPARIRWSSNQQGDYLNFSASKGGGFKTLTSGNLFIPACVKLWQNPQSIDTLTVLCLGLDGIGTAYYMNPGTSITSQTQAQTVMGFEETTATPGTVSPYGCEVMNNALYHPLDSNLMKSTASNYNINHLTVADPIRNLWEQVKLSDKRRMVSSQMSPNLYYLIQSPVGWQSAPTANGNQVWVCDTLQTNIWSAWDVTGTALRKLEVDGLLYMAVVSGPNIFVFNQEKDFDDYWNGTAWEEKGIAWEAVTNTQGANRAHDMWALVQQMAVTFGNFTGECVYGMRGTDVNGKWVDINKHYIAPQKTHDPLDRYDQTDYLLIRRVFMEWEFYWRSADLPKNRSYGSVNYVQYRTSPSTVNTGYEQGSIETFEYGAKLPESINGVTTPYADTRRP